MTHEHFHQESPLAVHEKGSVSDETFDDFLAAEMKDRGLIHINATD